MEVTIERIKREFDIDVVATTPSVIYEVTLTDGTGIVHIAPAFGQEDYEVGRKYDLPVVNPVDETGKYTEGPWKGRFVLEPELELEISNTNPEPTAQLNTIITPLP